MNIAFTEKKVKVPPQLKMFAERKMDKLDRYFRSDADASVTFSEERGQSIVEITVRADNMYYKSHQLSPDLFASLDNAVEAIVRQIHKNKTRLVKKLRQGAFEKILPAEAVAPEVEEEKEFPIVRSKKIAIKPMTPDEAILQMNLLGHEFFVFKNQLENEQFTVVYRRNGGGYGMISES